MEKIFHNFDFRKEAEQKRASELSAEEKERLITESHESALKRNKKIEKLSRARGQTPGEVDKSLQSAEDREMDRYEERKREYDDARFRDRTYGGIHTPVIRPQKPTPDD